jgi:hypothetical protein
MTQKKILALVISMLSLLVVGVWAQTRRDPTAITTAPHVISGADVGVRVTGPTDKEGRVPGVLVVKINGQWVDVISSSAVIGAGK